MIDDSSLFCDDNFGGRCEAMGVEAMDIDWSTLLYHSSGADDAVNGRLQEISHSINSQPPRYKPYKFAIYHNQL